MKDPVDMSEKEMLEFAGKQFIKKWKCFLDFEKRKYNCSEIIVRPKAYKDMLLKYESQGVHGYLQINIPEVMWEKLRKMTEPRPAKHGISRIE